MKEIKIKEVKPKKAKTNYAKEMMQEAIETKKDVTSALSAVSKAMKEEIAKKANFANNASMSKQEIAKKSDELADAVTEYMEKHGITTVQAEFEDKQSQEEETPENQNTSNTLKNEIKDLLNEKLSNPAKEEETKPQSPNNQDSKQLESNLTCTKDEREFLDVFYAIQEAGMLLGMATTGRNIANSELINLEIYPRMNVINQSDKLKVDEQNASVEVYSLITLKVLELVKSTKKMLTAKNII